jgi:hypothetical protein
VAILCCRLSRVVVVVSESLVDVIAVGEKRDKKGSQFVQAAADSWSSILLGWKQSGFSSRNWYKREPHVFITSFKKELQFVFCCARFNLREWGTNNREDSSSSASLRS